VLEEAPLAAAPTQVAPVGEREAPEVQRAITAAAAVPAAMAQAAAAQVAVELAAAAQAAVAPVGAAARVAVVMRPPTLSKPTAADPTVSTQPRILSHETRPPRPTWPERTRPAPPCAWRRKLASPDSAHVQADRPCVAPLASTSPPPPTAVGATQLAPRRRCVWQERAWKGAAQAATDARATSRAT
jgi:hypothetical protein